LGHLGFEITQALLPGLDRGLLLLGPTGHRSQCRVDRRGRGWGFALPVDNRHEIRRRSRGWGFDPVHVLLALLLALFLGLDVGPIRSCSCFGLPGPDAQEFQ